jgi:hypothetical protein
MCGVDLSSWHVCCITVNTLRTCNLRCSNVDVGDCFIVSCVFECIHLIITPPHTKKKPLKSQLFKDKLEYFGDCFLIKKKFPVCLSVVATLYGTSSLNSLARLIWLFRKTKAKKVVLNI